MNSKKNYKILLKFGKQNDILSLYNFGEVYFNTFEFFKELKFREDWRADKFEYSDLHYTGDDINICNLKIGIKNNLKEFSKENGVKSITIDFLYKEYTHIFCLSCIDIDWAKNNNKIIDERNFAENKDWILIINHYNVFLEKLKEAMDNMKLNYKIDFITYVDKASYSGDMGCFKKFDEYSFQNELRIAVKFPNKGPQKIFIGSLENIAYPPMDKNTFLNRCNIKIDNLLIPGNK